MQRISLAGISRSGAAAAASGGFQRGYPVWPGARPRDSGPVTHFGHRWTWNRHRCIGKGQQLTHDPRRRQSVRSHRPVRDRQRRTSARSLTCHRGHRSIRGNTEGSYLTGAATTGASAFMAWAAANTRRLEDRGDGNGAMLLLGAAQTCTLERLRLAMGHGRRLTQTTPTRRTTDACRRSVAARVPPRTARIRTMRLATSTVTHSSYIRATAGTSVHAGAPLSVGSRSHFRRIRGRQFLRRGSASRFPAPGLSRTRAMPSAATRATTPASADRPRPLRMGSGRYSRRAFGVRHEPDPNHRSYGVSGGGRSFPGRPCRSPLHS